jgi:hypothetical protein
MLFSVSATGQSTGVIERPPAPQTAATAADMQATSAMREPETQRARSERMANRSSRAQRDARHCLQHATNVEIIRCAERYR